MSDGVAAGLAEAGLAEAGLAEAGLAVPESGLTDAIAGGVVAVGPADGDPAEKTTASTIAAVSTTTATHAATKRRRRSPAKIDHMPDCGTIGHWRLGLKVRRIPAGARCPPVISPRNTVREESAQ